VVYAVCDDYFLLFVYSLLFRRNEKTAHNVLFDVKKQLLQIESLFKPINTSARINKLLFAGKKRVTL